MNMLVPLNKQAKAFRCLSYLGQSSIFPSTKQYFCSHHSSVTKTHQSALLLPPLHPQCGFNAFFIPPSKAHLYTSFFCTLIHLYLACGRFSGASDAFYSMRNHGLVPILPLWNRLLYEFNASGLVYQV